MSDLISRQAAIELVKDVCDAIMSECKSHYDSEVEDEVYDDILEVDAILRCNKGIRNALRDMPSAQPERKKGEWIRPFDAQASSYRYQCSVCGRTAYQVTGNCGRKHKVSRPPCTYKFCPNCGADMRGEDDVD